MQAQINSVKSQVFFNKYKEVREKINEIRQKGGNKEELETLEKRKRGLKKAMKRVKKGIYGTCVVCGKEISKERLRSSPLAFICNLCKN